jgi:flagellar protein FlbD
MIRLTRLNHLALVLNSDLIEHIDVTPDTVIVMTTGQRFMVLETPEEIVSRVIDFRRLILQAAPAWAARPAYAATELQRTE